VIRKFLGASALFLVVVLGFTSESNAQLTINLDFGNFNSGAPANGSSILGGANLSDAQGVIEAAATYWENAFANSSSSIGWSTNVGGNLVQDIDVNWASLGGSTLATGGTNFFGDGRWGGNSSLTWDNDGSSNFYVDPHIQWRGCEC